MTSPPSSPWPKRLPKRQHRLSGSAIAILLTAAFVATSCASWKNFFSSSPQEAGAPHKKKKKTLSSQFEWAVQDYEAGQYTKAVTQFQRLRAAGPSLPDYDLVAYYIGMSQFRLGQYSPAIQELESFLRTSPEKQEAQDARIALLVSYEHLALWSKALGLAVETNHLTLFQYNRALLKLVWARALSEQGELMGAKAELKETLQYLDRSSHEESSLSSMLSDPDQDLWGRYHFTLVALQNMECSRLTPPERKSKQRARLYLPWLESVTDCYRQAFTVASQDLFAKESLWTEQTNLVLTQGIDAFGQRILGYLRDESKILERHRALEKNASEQLYRLLGLVDEFLKDFKNRGIATSPLESLRKRLDLLLVAIARPS